MKQSWPDFIDANYNVNMREKSMTEFLKDLKAALIEMLEYPKSYLLEVAVRMEDNVFPMVPQGKGVSEIVLCKEDI